MTILENDLPILSDTSLLQLLFNDEYLMLRILANTATEHFCKGELSKQDKILTERGLAILSDTHENLSFLIGFFKGTLNNYRVKERYLWNVIYFFISHLIELRKGGVI